MAARLSNFELDRGLELDGSTLASAIRVALVYYMTCSYAQKHHKNYNRCYKNYPMKVDEWVEHRNFRQMWWL